MKKSTKKNFILIMSIALVACSVAVFSMVKDGNVGDAGKTTSALAEGSDRVTDNEANSEPGTEKNLENVNSKLIITDAEGNDIELSDVDKENYDGFIYKLNDGDTLTADSLEEISDAVAANSIEYVEPDYKAELLELDEADVSTEEIVDEQTRDAEDVEEVTDEQTQDAESVVEEDGDDEAGSVEEKAEEGTEDAEIDDAEYSPNDEYYSDYGWVQKLVKADKVWNKGCFGSKDVTVAVIDSGVYSTHSDLKSSSLSGAKSCTLLKGRYFVKGEEGSGAQDNYWHGTFCTGLIAATHNNKIGIAGETPNITILPIKVFDSSDGTSTYGGDISDISKAIRYAADNGADVISMSLGITYSAPQTLNEACQYAVDKGVILVAASGNNYSSVKNYPASFDNVISVGSVDSDATRSYFSNYNDAVDVVAAGNNVCGLSLKNGYRISRGTSFSTPQVAALAAMAKSIVPDMNAVEFEALIKYTSYDLGTEGRDDYYGYGLADFEAAYDCLSNSKNIKDCTLTLKECSFVYNGQSIEPSTMVVDSSNSKELVLGEDYEIAYCYDNINVGTATCIIRGINNYCGYNSVTFTIEQRDISEFKDVSSVPDKVYNGYRQKPSTKVIGVNGDVLTKGTDYTVSYSNNVNVCDDTAVATISGTGNYTGSFELNFSIAKANIANYGAVGSVTYTGKAVCPKVYSMGGLKSGSDYAVTYSNNVKLGYGYVKIKAIGKNTYGTKKLKFKIRPKGTAIKKLGRAKKAVTVKWSKQKAKMPKSRITGYQVQIAKNSKFTKGKKSRKIKGYYKVSKKFSGLARKTRYYTRVRTYIKTSNGTLYSKWSGVKSTTTK